MSVKISIVGAGSAVFSLGLVRDICLTPNLEGSTISFMDINEERLNTVYTLCKRYAEELGVKLNLEKTLDLRESLRETGFVINSALSASHDRLREGWSIAFKHGYRFGGSYHIVHDEAFWINFYQFRLFESILDNMQELCPSAWYIQVANPVLAGITYLSRKYKGMKVVGLCHGFGGIYHIASVLGLEKERINFQIPGVNHFVFLTHFTYKGENAYPLLDRWIEEKAEDYWKTCGFSDHMGPKPVDVYKRFGLYPIGDTATPGGGTWPWWYHVDDETEKRWKEDPKTWYEGYFVGGKQRVEEMNKLAKDSSMKLTEVYPPKSSGEVIIPLVESIALDIPRVLQVNIPNTGKFIEGIPQDFEVEIPALVSKKGIQGIKVNGLPKSIIGLILRERVAPVEMELSAYIEGSKEKLLQLILMDPWTKSEEQARAFLEEILSLPSHKEMREHYR
jgi:alpha-galactosidase